MMTSARRIWALGALSIVGLLTLSSRALAAPVPEIDPGMATGGIALLTAGVLLLVERHRRR